MNRTDVEYLTDTALESLVKEGIDELRRRNIRSAEGLVSRHRELMNRTELEAATALAKEYTELVEALKKKSQQDLVGQQLSKIENRPRLLRR